jgi:mono/diheme cytochrome c family protein
MKDPIIKLAAVAALLVAVAAYSQMMGMGGGGGMMNMSIRHSYVMQNGVDPAYASRMNPLQHTAANIADGKRLFETNCALCHGPAGLGNGEAGKALNPPPANIAVNIKRRMATDGYVYWTIAEGGAPVGSQMPPFKDVLKKDEIWKTILYLRTL